MKRIWFKVAAVGLLGLSAGVHAEDIDLFVGNTSAEPPNVLIILDNTANWSSHNAYQGVTAALSGTFTELPVDRFRVGLMLFSESGGDNTNIQGGYVRAAMRKMTSTTKPLYANLIAKLNETGDKGSAAYAGLAMAEAYRYLSAGNPDAVNAGVPYAGNGKEKTDYFGNVHTQSKYAASSAASKAVWALDATLHGKNALQAKAGTLYNSTILSGCQKNFIIYISNGPATDNTAAIKQSNIMLTAAGGDTSPISVSPSGLAENPSDEWARFLHEGPVAARTYTIDVNPGTSGQGPNWTALLKSMADAGDGKYFAVSTDGGGSEQVASALKQILSEIQSINSVFASVSLPVSVNTQGTYLNQVYIGMFRPDGSAKPRWAGNLKQFKLGFIDNTLKLQDADNDAAISSSGSGFISECARSYWTPLKTNPDSYWANFEDDDANCIGYPAQSNTPDGNMVEKGAQGYMVRSLSGVSQRDVKTCNADCTGMVSLSPSTPGAITKLALGDSTMSDAQQTALINWARGENTGRDLPALDSDGAVLTDENGDPLPANEDEQIVSASTIRPSAHGDIVHSRPIALNYGTLSAPDVVVFYGGNDGLLHAVDGDRTSTGAGQELWSFLAPEFAPHISRLRQNSPLISFENIADGEPKPYGVDGPITAYRSSTGSESILFATLRRGGRAIYAFDVSDPTSPSLEWKADSSTLANLGQTWSSVKGFVAPGYVNETTAEELPLAIFGGGYDAECEDTDPYSCTRDPVGNSIFLVEARTGDLVREFPTERGVVADLTTVPDSNGNVLYFYTADLGGNVYRISGQDALGNPAPISNSHPDTWIISKIAALGGSGSDARKFMFAPDVVVDGDGYVLLLGSGDREKPLNTYTGAMAVENRFYAIKDKPTTPDWLVDACGTADYICDASLFPITTTATPTEDELSAHEHGWYLQLASTEQVVTSAITVFGTVTFSTHQPTPLDATECATLGIANVYNVSYEDASGVDGERFARIDGDGLPPSPVAGVVTLDDGSTMPFCIGCKDDSPLEGGEPPTPPIANQPKAKVYWNIER